MFNIIAGDVWRLLRNTLDLHLCAYLYKMAMCPSYRFTLIIGYLRIGL